MGYGEFQCLDLGKESLNLYSYLKVNSVDVQKTKGIQESDEHL